MAGGIATYSNIEAIASSYAIIFDNLWKITEFAENLRIANIKLESNEKAMKEFVNIVDMNLGHQYNQYLDYQKCWLMLVVMISAAEETF